VAGRAERGTQSAISAGGPLSARVKVGMLKFHVSVFRRAPGRRLGRGVLVEGVPASRRDPWGGLSEARGGFHRFARAHTLNRLVHGQTETADDAILDQGKARFGGAVWIEAWRRYRRLDG